MTALAAAGLAIGGPLCRPAIAAGAAPQIVFVSPRGGREAFWNEVAACMREAATQLDLQLEVQTGARNRDALLAAIAAPRRPDLLVMANVERAARPALEAAATRGIPCLVLLDELVGVDAEAVGAPRAAMANYLGSLVCDERGAATQIAARLIDQGMARNWLAADGALHLLALGGDPASPNAAARLEGLDQATGGVRRVMIDRVLPAYWDGETAGRLTGRYLVWAARNGIRPAGVWAASEPMAAAAMQAFAAAGFAAGTEAGFVTLGWSAAVQEGIAAGRLLASAGGSPLAGGLAMVLLRDWFDGHDFVQQGSARLGFTMIPLDSETLPAFRERFGPDPWSRIDFRSFTRGRRGAGMAYDFSPAALQRAVWP